MKDKEGTQSGFVKKIKIGMKIAILFGLTTLLVLGFLAGIVVYMSASALERTTELYTEEIGAARADELSAHIKEYVRFALDEASRNVIRGGTQAEIERTIAEKMREMGTYVADIFYVNNAGDFVTSTGATGNVADRDYFQAVVRENASWAISNPTISRTLNVPIVVVAAPVMRAGRVDGMIGLQVTLTSLSDSISKINIDNAGFGFLVDRTGLVIAHHNPQYVLELNTTQSDAAGFSGLAALGRRMIAGERGVGRYTNPEGIVQRAFFAPVPGTGWSLAITVQQEYILRNVVVLTSWVIGISLASLLVILLVSFIIGRSVAKPVGATVVMATRIASGDLGEDVDGRYLERGDEIGQLANAFQSMIVKLRQVIGEMSSAAQQVSAGAQQLSGSAQQMSQGATEQASSVEEISSSMEEMSSNVRQNADNALQTERIAQQSAAKAEEGGKSVSSTVEAMREIASKISIIEEIARSTNMLSLNASIEAARAGEYGKGFAVVAAEVGKLAERSQKEAAEISRLSGESVAIAEKAGATINELLPEIRRTAELVQEISAASGEQNSGVEQINAAIMQLDQVVQQNASMSEESASMAEELAGQAEQMSATVSYFRIDSSGVRETPHASVKRPLDTAPAAKKPVPAQKPAPVPRQAPAKKASVPPVVAEVAKKMADEKSAAQKTSGAVTGVSSPKEESRLASARSVKPKRLPVGGIDLNLDDDHPRSAKDAMDSEFEEF